MSAPRHRSSRSVAMRRGPGRNRPSPVSRAAGEHTAHPYDRLPDIVARFDRSLRHIYVNRAVERQLGLEPEAFLGKTHAEFGMSAPLATLWMDALTRVFETGISERVEFRFPTPAGMQDYECEIVPETEADGSFETLLAIGRNISRRKRAEAERQKLLEIVSHDLRNPLASILLQADLILGRREEEASDAVRESAGYIVDSAERMDRLVTSLLSAASLEAGQLQLDLVDWPVGDLLRETVWRFAPQARMKGIHLEVDTAPGANVRADPERISQVLQNLLDNALRFTPEGGRVELDAERRGDRVWVSVCDTGPGIAEPDLARIFDRYWQAERTKSGNAGLGLSIAQGIVEAHGGRIWAVRTPGPGTAILFTLPAAPG